MTKFWAISVGIIIFFTSAYILLVLNKYWHFDYFFTDNVYIDTALWKVANLEAPIVHHALLGKINILGDHFEPAIFLLSPLYKLFPNQETILIAMVIPYILSLLIAFFLYRGTQNAFLFGFHEVSFISFFFMLSMFFLISKRTKLFVLSLLLLLLSKESAVGIIASVLFFMFFAFKNYRRLVLILFTSTVSYYFLVTKLLIPHYSGRYKIYFNKDTMFILAKVKEACFDLKNPYCIPKT